MSLIWSHAIGRKRESRRGNARLHSNLVEIFKLDSNQSISFIHERNQKVPDSGPDQILVLYHTGILYTGTVHRTISLRTWEHVMNELLAQCTHEPNCVAQVPTYSTYSIWHLKRLMALTAWKILPDCWKLLSQWQFTHGAAQLPLNFIMELK